MLPADFARVSDVVFVAWFPSSKLLKSLLRMPEVSNGKYLVQKLLSRSELFKSLMRISEVKNGKYLVQDTALEL